MVQFPLGQPRIPRFASTRARVGCRLS